MIDEEDGYEKTSTQLTAKLIWRMGQPYPMGFVITHFFCSVQEAVQFYAENQNYDYRGAIVNNRSMSIENFLNKYGGYN